MAENEKKIDPRLLAEVSNKVQIDAVLVEQISCKRLGWLRHEGEVLLAFEFTTPWQLVNERPGFDVRLEFRATMFTNTDPDDESVQRVPLAEISMVLLLAYTLSELPAEDWTDRLNQFAQVNAVVNAWPYLRAEVQDLTTKMGVPTIVLPVYRPGKPQKATLGFRPA